MAIKRFIYNHVVKLGVEEEHTSGQARTEAIKWFKRHVSKLQKLDPKSLHRETKDTSRTKIQMISRPGDMYLFHYKPVYKKPYYDRFPLAVVTDIKSDGFLGLNFHFLPYQQRILLINQLYRFLTDSKFDDKTRLKLSYQLLKSLSGKPYFRPCVRQYINTRAVSQFTKIHPAEWEIALMLPAEKFVHETKNRIWENSLKKYDL